MNELDRCEGFDVGFTYNNPKAGAVFLSSIANIERDRMAEALSEIKFVPITMDGPSALQMMGEWSRRPRF